ncbi:MAG: hypothetical protein KKH61_21630 [Gammaproteobacteria bacterium]|nr:hypothetical protein [Gammaproteobacteria bacterium]
MNWYRLENNEWPNTGDKIIVKPIGLKGDVNYLYLQVKEGEGLGAWFNEWCYLDSFLKEKEAFNEPR